LNSKKKEKIMPYITLSFRQADLSGEALFALANAIYVTNDPGLSFILFHDVSVKTLLYNPSQFRIASSSTQFTGDVYLSAQPDRGSDPILTMSGGVPNNTVSVQWPTREGSRQQPLTNDQPVTLVGFSG
jgi:hypothetical protein